MILWLDGRLLPADAARIDPSDRGLLLGDGLFETIRAAQGAPQRLDAHLARLRDGARTLGIPVPAGDEALGDAMAALLAANGLAEAALRLTLTRGPAPRGLLPPAEPRPTLMIAAFPLPSPLAPARAVIARGTRRNEHSPLSRLKSLNYLDGILARQEAARRGADEALMLNTAGRLAEATAANLFVAMDGRLATPPVSEGALPGIRRAEVIAALGAEERPIHPADLDRAGEVFLTTSLGIRPVVAVEGRPVGDGRPGPVTERLMRARG